MECLNGDLNNYEDVRTLEELRAKNKELKVKLEEHSTAKEKLQKDYDNLKIKFKQLENNYSSLLITARSELQRKTQLTTIKTEKDLMVLNAFKSGRIIKRNFDTDVKNPYGKHQGRPSKINNNTKEDTVKQKNVDIKQVRREAPVLPAKDADPDPSCLACFFCKYNRNKHDNNGVKLDLLNKMNNNVNDNIVQQKTELKKPPNTTASSIRDRRKSTLTVSIPIKALSFSDFPRKHRKLADDYPSQKCVRYLGRSLESPPPETSYSGRQHTKADPQSDYDRYPHDQEKVRYYHDDKYSAKCRSKDYNDILIKRQTQRTESYEIMATAATTLGDPRVTSNRYVIRKENGKEVLTTVVGRNIDIIPVNKVMWNIKPMDIPVALLRRPSQCCNQLAKHIYMDINNPVTNLDESMESVEVRRTGDEINEIHSKVRKNEYNTQDLKISKQPPEEMSKETANAKTVSEPNTKKYRIPKISQFNKNTHSKIGVPIIDLGENVPHHKYANANRKGEAEYRVPKELKPHIQQYNKRKDFAPNTKLDGHKNSKSRHRSEGQYQSTLTGMASDLELSEDTSDHMNTNIRVVPEKVQKHCEIPLNMNEVISKDSVNSVGNKTVASSHNTEIKSTNSTKEQKPKKKQSKSNEIFNDSVENSGELIHVLEKKRKLKKEKKSTPKETNEKFCDLFGDRSREGLGIPSYLPISEDAQDDMKIHQIAAPLLYKDEIPGHILHPNRVEVIMQKTTAHEDIPKADLNNNNDIEERNTSSKMLTYTKLPSPIVYENLFPEFDINDSNVVKTVIPSSISGCISARIQPEIEDENKKELTKSDTYVKVNDIQNTKDHHLPATKKIKKDILKPSSTIPSIVYENLYPGSDLNDPNVVIISTGTQPEIEYENKKHTTQNTKDIVLFPATKRLKTDTLKAFPMSTLHKEFSATNPLEVDAAKTDVICDPCVSAAVATITNIAPVVNQTEKNTLESNDEPDVRIVVKSRRKVKRSPTTLTDNRN